MNKVMDLSCLTPPAQKTAMKIIERMGWKFQGGSIERANYEIPEEDEDLFNFLEIVFS